MAYNSYFPATYPQFYQQYTQIPQPQQQQQMMTPPTIRAEIVQVGSKAEAMNFPVGAGQTQMMIMRDDSAIFIKSAFANGQANLDEYIKKPHEDSVSTEYVTRTEFEQRLSALLNQRRENGNEQQPVSVTRKAKSTNAEPGTNTSAGQI